MPSNSRRCIVRESVLACLPTVEHVEGLLRRNASERSTLKRLLKLSQEALAVMDADGEGTSDNGADELTEEEDLEDVAAAAGGVA